jgi:hypothetical protein
MTTSCGSAVNALSRQFHFQKQFICYEAPFLHCSINKYIQMIHRLLQITHFIHSEGLRLMLCHDHFTSMNEPVPIMYEAGWASGLVWMGVENLTPTGMWPQNIKCIACHYTNSAIPSHRVKKHDSIKYKQERNVALHQYTGHSYCKLNSWRRFLSTAAMSPRQHTYQSVADTP